MNSKRFYFVMLGVTVLFVVMGGVSLFAGNVVIKRQSSKLSNLKLENRLLDEQQAALTQANKDISEYEDLEKAAKLVVPQDKDQARAVREIISIGAKSGISISSITFPASSLGTKPGQANTGANNSNPDSTGEKPKTTTAPPPISQATPVEGVSGIYALEMVITPDSSKPTTYYQMLDFLERLENNRRTAQITSVKVTPKTDDVNNPLVVFTLTLNIFVKP